MTKTESAPHTSHKQLSHARETPRPDDPEKRCTLEIQKGNDAFRKDMFDSPHRDRYIMTLGVSDSPYWETILEAVHAFSEFEPEKGPHQEHDFGKVTVEGEDYFFKIDYFDHTMRRKVDPYEEEPTRLLTIMHAEKN